MRAPWGSQTGLWRAMSRSPLPRWMQQPWAYILELSDGLSQLSTNMKSGHQQGLDSTLMASVQPPQSRPTPGPVSLPSPSPVTSRPS